MDNNFDSSLIKYTGLIFLVVCISSTTNFYLEKKKNPAHFSDKNGLLSENYGANKLNELENEVRNVIQNNQTLKALNSESTLELMSLQNQVTELQRSLNHLNYNESHGLENNNPDLNKKNNFSLEENEMFADQIVETQHLAQVQSMDDILYSEAEDTEWSNFVAIAMNNALNQQQLQSVDILEHVCGTTLCKTHISFEALEGGVESIDEFISMITDEDQGYAEVDEENDIAILYFSKPGISLPHL